MSALAWLFDLLGRAAIAAGCPAQLPPGARVEDVYDDVRIDGKQMIFIEWSMR